MGSKRDRLAEAGIEGSVGTVGDSYDNALAEIRARGSMRTQGSEPR